MVGMKKFAYTEKGKKEAKEYAKKTGKKTKITAENYDKEYGQIYRKAVKAKK